MATSEEFVQRALSQVGKPYVLGATPKLYEASPKAFDCWELVRWSAWQAGLRTIGSIPLDSDAVGYTVPAYAACIAAGGRKLIMAEARATRGALVWVSNSGKPDKIHHVGISLGLEGTVEARGLAYGVDKWRWSKRQSFNLACLMPGLQYASLDEAAIAATQNFSLPGWGWAKAHYVCDGTAPKGPATREQVAQMIYNYHRTIAESSIAALKEKCGL